MLLEIKMAKLVVNNKKSFKNVDKQILLNIENIKLLKPSKVTSKEDNFIIDGNYSFFPYYRKNVKRNVYYQLVFILHHTNLTKEIIDQDLSLILTTYNQNNEIKCKLEYDSTNQLWYENPVLKSKIADKIILKNSLYQKSTNSSFKLELYLKDKKINSIDFNLSCIMDEKNLTKIKFKKNKQGNKLTSKSNEKNQLKSDKNTINEKSISNKKEIDKIANLDNLLASFDNVIDKKNNIVSVDKSKETDKKVVKKNKEFKNQKDQVKNKLDKKENQTKNLDKTNKESRSEKNKITNKLDSKESSVKKLKKTNKELSTEKNQLKNKLNNKENQIKNLDKTKKESKSQKNIITNKLDNKENQAKNVDSTKRELKSKKIQVKQQADNKQNQVKKVQTKNQVEINKEVQIKKEQITKQLDNKQNQSNNFVNKNNKHQEVKSNNNQPANKAINKKKSFKSKENNLVKEENNVVKSNDINKVEENKKNLNKINEAKKLEKIDNSNNEVASNNSDFIKRVSSKNRIIQLSKDKALDNLKSSSDDHNYMLQELFRLGDELFKKDDFLYSKGKVNMSSLKNRLYDILGFVERFTDTKYLETFSSSNSSHNVTSVPDVFLSSPSKDGKIENVVYDYQTRRDILHSLKNSLVWYEQAYFNINKLTYLEKIKLINNSNVIVGDSNINLTSLYFDSLNNFNRYDKGIEGFYQIIDKINSIEDKEQASDPYFNLNIKLKHIGKGSSSFKKINSLIRIDNNRFITTISSKELAKIGYKMTYSNYTVKDKTAFAFNDNSDFVLKLVNNDIDQHLFFLSQLFKNSYKRTFKIFGSINKKNGIVKDLDNLLIFKCSSITKINNSKLWRYKDQSYRSKLRRWFVDDEVSDLKILKDIEEEKMLFLNSLRVKFFSYNMMKNETEKEIAMLEDCKRAIDRILELDTKNYEAVKNQGYDISSFDITNAYTWFSMIDVIENSQSFNFLQEKEVKIGDTRKIHEYYCLYKMIKILTKEQNWYLVNKFDTRTYLESFLSGKDNEGGFSIKLEHEIKNNEKIELEIFYEKDIKSNNNSYKTPDFTFKFKLNNEVKYVYMDAKYHDNTNQAESKWRKDIKEVAIAKYIDEFKGTDHEAIASFIIHNNGSSDDFVFYGERVIAKVSGNSEANHSYGSIPLNSGRNFEFLNVMRMIMEYHFHIYDVCWICGEVNDVSVENKIKSNGELSTHYTCQSCREFWIRERCSCGNHYVVNHLNNYHDFDKKAWSVKCPFPKELTKKK